MILGAALALPSYLSYEAFHSLTKHRFLCNLTSGSNAYIPSNTSLQLVAGTARPPGHGPEGPVADDRKNDLPAASRSPATPREHIANLATRFLPSTPRCEKLVRIFSRGECWFRSSGNGIKNFHRLRQLNRVSSSSEGLQRDTKSSEGFAEGYSELPEIFSAILIGAPEELVEARTTINTNIHADTRCNGYQSPPGRCRKPMVGPRMGRFKEVPAPPSKELIQHVAKGFDIFLPVTPFVN